MGNPGEPGAPNSSENAPKKPLVPSQAIRKVTARGISAAADLEARSGPVAASFCRRWLLKDADKTT